MMTKSLQVSSDEDMFEEDCGDFDLMDGFKMFIFRANAFNS